MAATPMIPIKRAAGLLLATILSGCAVGPDYGAPKTELTAFDQNLDLAAALARVEQAREAASAAGAQLLPTVDLDPSATAERQSVESPLGSLAGSLPG